ncbi:MAG: hypothetical protein COU27_01770 [Candidatus Levybacteria bacterium CG10_big_fil_rev_8_21_14_0_10_36_7]|nr:MAG: hypothetical protein COU27_01770 [Candidatus Levybacteria bacterium CG10_big_fil_rev_8_21_14_0_10_36_7]
MKKEQETRLEPSDDTALIKSAVEECIKNSKANELSDKCREIILNNMPTFLARTSQMHNGNWNNLTAKQAIEELAQEDNSYTVNRNIFSPNPFGDLIASICIENGSENKGGIKQTLNRIFTNSIGMLQTKTNTFEDYRNIINLSKTGNPSVRPGVVRNSKTPLPRRYISSFTR